MCKLHYLQFGFPKHRSSRSKMYFKIGAPKDFAMFAGPLFNKYPGLKLYQKETPIYVFSCEINEILKTPFF